VQFRRVHCCSRFKYTHDTLLKRSVGLLSHTVLFYYISLAHDPYVNVCTYPPIGYRWPDPDVYYRGKWRVPHQRTSGVSPVCPPVNRNGCFLSLSLETLNRFRRRWRCDAKDYIHPTPPPIYWFSVQDIIRHEYYTTRRLAILGFKIYKIWCWNIFRNALRYYSLLSVDHKFSHRSRVFVFKNHFIVYLRASCFDRPPLMFLLYFRRTKYLISISATLIQVGIILRVHKYNIFFCYYYDGRDHVCAPPTHTLHSLHPLIHFILRACTTSALLLVLRVYE